jgi:PAS domain S-box-containing protein
VTYTGKPEKEQLGYRWLEQLHPDDKDRTVSKWMDKVKSGERFDSEFRIRRNDGVYHWFKTTAVPMRDVEGNILKWFGSNTDIDEIKEAEEQLRKLNAELEDRVATRTAGLEASNKELEAFSYSVSHDLRAPLRHVSGYVELLAKHFQSELSEKGLHYLDSISDSAHQMGKLIDDLLQFSRTGRAEIHLSQLDMNGIVHEAVESVSKDNPDRAIEWVVGKLPSVSGDDATIRLVWINLLSNAAKFTRTRAKAVIEIGAKAGTKEVIYFVRDNGVGFNMKYAQKLFGVFQRLHSTEEFEGTGVGLAIVRRIITRHGGRTWAEAELDKGATFYFSIPHN